jgi:hypothetical protein
MTRERPPTQVPATSGYVLAKLLDEHRLLSPLDPEAEPDDVLDAGSTIAAWRNARDLPPTWPLGRALGESWGIARTDAEWRAVLEPARNRTLADLCAFIADSGATRPAFEPAGYLGASPCDAAGAFLAVRSILRESGADADAIKPSTPLAPYLERDMGVFVWGPIAGLAPGALPELREIPCPAIAMAETGLQRGIVPAIVLWLVASTAAMIWLPSWVRFAWFWCPWLVMYGIAISRKAVPAPLSSFELGGLRTFEDLARALAAGSHNRGA